MSNTFPFLVEDALRGFGKRYYPPDGMVNYGLPIGMMKKGSANHKIGRGPVASRGHIIKNGKPQQRFHVRVVGLGGQRIPEENKDIDIAVADFGSDLLVSA